MTRQQMEEEVKTMQAGWDLLLSQARIIAQFPLEEWLAAFDRAEMIAPTLDPTLYRDYVYDPEQKGEKIKELIRAAIPLKQQILKLQKYYTERQSGLKDE